MKYRNDFIDYVEEKLGQEYIVRWDDRKSEVGDEFFLVLLPFDYYKTKEDFLIKTKNDSYYYFSIINDIMNKLNRYYKKFNKITK